LLYVDSKTQLKGVISSIEGKKVAETNDARVIDVHGLADGVYLLSLYDAQDNVVKIVKVVKTTN